MNKVYLSGIVAEAPTCHTRDGSPEHMSFPLCVTHWTKQGVIKREQYPVHAWNGVATWVREHMRQGQRVLVQGYLTQRNITSPEGGNAALNEVTAEEFFAVSNREQVAFSKKSGECMEKQSATGRQTHSNNEPAMERKEA